jgi:protein ECT2
LVVKSSRTEELQKARAELENSRRQKEVLKQLLQDATAENEVLYSVRDCHWPNKHAQTHLQAFNQELDAMYEDVQLPEDQAWSKMMTDLQTAKKTRNQLSKENM